MKTQRFPRSLLLLAALLALWSPARADIAVASDKNPAPEAVLLNPQDHLPAETQPIPEAAAGALGLLALGMLLLLRKRG